MGWNLAIVHAAGPAATVEGFALENGYRPDPDAGEPTFEDLLFGPDDDGDWARPPLGITELGAGLLLAARLILSHDWAAGLSARKGQATWAVWQSTTDTYGFAHYRDGVVVREVQRSAGEVLHEEGEPLPEERPLRWNDPARPPDDEADLFALVEAVTHLPDAPRWLAGPARVYRPVPIVDLEPPTKKRRFRR